MHWRRRQKRFAVSARVAAALASIPGVRTFATQTNFVLARVPDAAGWNQTLRDARILVKNLDGWHPLLAGCLRITVGTPAENDALIATLRQAYAPRHGAARMNIEERA